MFVLFLIYIVLSKGDFNIVIIYDFNKNIVVEWLFRIYILVFRILIC